MDHPEFNRLPDEALIRLCTLMAWGLVPFSPSTLWRKCRNGEFPRPLKVSRQITAWRVGEVRRWAQSPADFFAESSDRNKTKQPSEPGGQNET